MQFLVTIFKSRARNNFVAFNRLTDREDGRSSYTIDLPEGGRAYVIGNELQQGPATENVSMVAFAAEASDKGDNELVVAFNTFYNRRVHGVSVNNHSPSRILVANNIFVGAPGVILKGKGQTSGNLSGAGIGLSDGRNEDYSLKATSLAIDSSASMPEKIVRMLNAEYVHPMDGRCTSAGWSCRCGRSRVLWTLSLLKQVYDTW